MSIIQFSSVSSSPPTAQLGKSLIKVVFLGVIMGPGCGDSGSQDNCPGSEWDNCCEFIEKCHCVLYDPSPTGGDAYEEEELDISPNVCRNTDPNHCWRACQIAYGQVADAIPEITPCNNDSSGEACGETSSVCAYWNPSLHITGTGSARDINQSFLDSLESDPTPLLRCDTARLTSGNVIQYASTDDALYLAGLRNGDQLVSANGWSITTPGELAVAFVALWVLNSTGSYSVTVDRGGTPTTLTWDIIPPTL